LRKVCLKKGSDTQFLVDVYDERFMADIKKEEVTMLLRARASIIGV
jgi:hypothetical protein